jgi:hypothetical protein
VAAVGGLVVSQALTLFTIPVTYLYMERFSEWLGGFRRRRRGRAADLPSDHALVPAGNYLRPAVVSRQAAE